MTAAAIVGPGVPSERGMCAHPLCGKKPLINGVSCVKHWDEMNDASRRAVNQAITDGEYAIAADMAERAWLP